MLVHRSKMLTELANGYALLIGKYDLSERYETELIECLEEAVKQEDSQHLVVDLAERLQKQARYEEAIVHIQRILAWLVKNKKTNTQLVLDCTLLLMRQKVYRIALRYLKAIGEKSVKMLYSLCKGYLAEPGNRKKLIKATLML